MKDTVTGSAMDTASDDADETPTRIMFLYQLVAGAAARSYGINVARLAGSDHLYSEAPRMTLSGCPTTF